MTQRINFFKQAPDLSQKLVDIGMLLRKSDIDPQLLDLIHIRASQLNGCAFCLDMHVKEARIHGERELRLHHVAIWRESRLFSERERAALAWTEALTQLPPHGVPDTLYEEARAHFDERQLTQLSFAIAAINAWNRLNVGFAAQPGTLDKAYGLDKAGLS